MSWQTRFITLTEANDCTSYQCGLLTLISAADIVFTVKDKPHERFTREGSDLIYKPIIPLVTVSSVTVSQLIKLGHICVHNRKRHVYIVY